MNCSQYLDNPGREPGATFVCCDVQAGNGDRQTESSRPRAARVDELHAVALNHCRLVRVAGHDDVEAGSAWVHINLIHVVEDVNADIFELQCEVKRDLRRPGAFVVVTPDRVDRRYGPQFLENLRPADVARMNDVLNARQCADRFGAKQSVRVGDEAYRSRQQRFGSAPQLRNRARAPALNALWPVLPILFVLRNFAATHNPA